MTVQSTPKRERHADRFGKRRIFVRELASERYTLTDERRMRLATVPRVIMHKIDWQASHRAGEMSILQPSDEPFRSQSLHCHFEVLEPGELGNPHGHQNEALFYWLEGRGFDVHDGVRYQWAKGDVTAVHNDTVHSHSNADPDDIAVALVLKAKPTWLFLGMCQQGVIGTRPPDEERWGPAVEWSVARAPEDEQLKKVIRPGDTPWQWTPHGHVRLLADASVPLRVKAVDVYLQDIRAGSRSGRRWQMADEVFYVMEGRGYDLHWEVEVELTDRYYARIANEPMRIDWRAGDVVWIPQNTIFQHVNADDSTATVKLISASNRLYKTLGYPPVDLEPAPEYPGRPSSYNQVKEQQGVTLAQPGPY